MKQLLEAYQSSNTPLF